MLLVARTLTNGIALIYAIAILIRARRIVKHPWAFIFIAMRVSTLLLLNCVSVLGVLVSLFILDVLKIIWAVLDLLTLIEIVKGYNTLFETT